LSTIQLGEPGDDEKKEEEQENGNKKQQVLLRNRSDEPEATSTGTRSELQGCNTRDEHGKRPEPKPSHGASRQGNVVANDHRNKAR
jgi:hypothetical protein